MENYLSELYSQGASQATVKAYRKDLIIFHNWFTETNGHPPKPIDLTSIDLREYQGY